MTETSIFQNYSFDKNTGWRLGLPADIPPGKRVLNLYRVSSDQQLYHNEKDEADIPMQRKRCREFCEQMGWTLVCELQEEGVSGHKVRAANRDKIQQIKQYALEKKFDILLVHLFDRIGRISDETPFVVEWLVRNGIRVWSVEEGEQKIENHTDKLLNYIRYWQADGESIKTSIRTANSLHILTKDGLFTGGVAAYGYRAVKLGRLNKRKQEVCDLEINEEEAYVIRKMFQLAAYEGYGAQRIANYLNANGYKNRSGKNWHPATIQSILRNVLYIGILRSGDARSQVLEHLRIVDDKTFYIVQDMLDARSRKHQDTRSTSLNTRGNSLLAGNVFCGHCGARLCITTSGQGRPRMDGTDARRVRYTCQTHSRTHGDCDGQTGYTVEKLDKDIELIVLGILKQVKRISRSEAMALCYTEEVKAQKAFVKNLERDLDKTSKILANLRDEIPNAIIGESAFEPRILNDAIQKQEQRYKEQHEALSTAKQELANEEDRLMEIGNTYNEMLDWAYAYEKSSISAKKVIVSHLIERVDVFRGYKLKIKFRIGIEKFLVSMANSA